MPLVGKLFLKKSYRPVSVNPPKSVTQHLIAAQQSGGVHKLTPERRHAIAVAGIISPKAPGQ